MHARRWIAFAGLVLLLISGCGGGSMTGTGTQQAGAVPVSGNWAFTPPIGSISLPPFVGGSLTPAGNQVSADVLVLLLTNSSCSLTGGLDTTLTGAVTNSALKLTSAPWNGSVFTATGTVSSDGKTIPLSWSAKGGCADGLSGSMIASWVPPLTGTLTGTASDTLTGTANPLTGSTVTLDLQQSATPEQFAFPLTGSITFPGAGCGFTSGNLIQLGDQIALTPSTVIGDEWALAAQMNDGKSLVVLAGAADLVKPGQWIAAIAVSGGTCDGDGAAVTFTQN
ncbi:MAG: hypothetical protein WA294_04720 [Acidobacteriaceae bacterium]